MRRAIIVAMMAVMLALVGPVSSYARVVSFVIQQTRPFADGKSFGDVGPYERLDGVVYMEVDPRDPLNAIIVNLDKAPKNAKGLVEFSSPFFILKPVDTARGNHKILYGVNNRGNKLELGWRTILPPGVQNNNNPISAADAADGLLFRLGYTFVDAGWQGNVAPGNDRLLPNLPVATLPDGSPIVAKVRVEYMDRSIPQAGTFSLNLEGEPNVAPPKSNYPSIEDQTLVPLATAAAAFPAIPGVTFPSVRNELSFPDFGPGFTSKGGYVTKLPPVLGSPYQVLAPKSDGDGLDIAGIRPMEVAVPTSTLTGWNVRAAGHRRPELCELNGSYIPFAKTKAERQQNGDPRLSLEERYGDHAGYVRAIETAAQKLVKDRFLLQEDADRYIQAAKASDVLR